MTEAFETMADYAVAVLIAAGMVWVFDRMVFGLDAPGLFS